MDHMRDLVDLSEEPTLDQSLSASQTAFSDLSPHAVEPAHTSTGLHGAQHPHFDDSEAAVGAGMGETVLAGWDILQFDTLTGTPDQVAPDTHFGPEGNPFLVVGDPMEATEHWHQQQRPDTCAVVAQEFILDEITGRDFSEEELCREAADHGWYSPGGTPPESVGNLLELHGIDVERAYNATLSDLQSEVAVGHHVIVGVNAETIVAATHGEDLPLTDLPVIPGQQANHAVQVIGINYTDPARPTVVLNDPGLPDGRGLEVPLADFECAWATSDHFMMYTTSQPVDGAIGYVHRPVFAGYYNADGTYHWTSDNTDRDPETGAIIRRW